MIEINIRHNFPEVMRKLKEVTESVGNKAMVRALNTTIDQGKVQMAKQITQEFRVSSAEVKKRLEIRKASTKSGAFRFEAVLSASKKTKGRSMNLIAFQTGALTKRTAKKAGRADAVGQLGFQIKRGGGRKVIPGAFIGNQGRTVFIRTGKPRLPIKAISTIDIPQMFNTKRINQVVRQVMTERFSANFQRELRTVLKGFAK